MPADVVVLDCATLFFGVSLMMVCWLIRFGMLVLDGVSMEVCGLVFYWGNFAFAVLHFPSAVHSMDCRLRLCGE
jgi:hypothetical protein